MMAQYTCDYEHCLGRRRDARKVLAYHQKYLFLHKACLPFARKAARDRGETFGLRFGI